ncbi:hypothetical protein E8E11_011730 [Didymella keratinophila]|nr:hypothetical protein E8E11_011730 [Didymella keratinophila]
MRLSPAVICGLAGAAFAAPTTDAPVKPKNATIHLSQLHSNATESFAALHGITDKIYQYQHSFIVVAEQHCDKSRTETSIGFYPVYNFGNGKPDRAFPNSPTMTTTCGLDPVTFDEDDWKTFHTLEPRLTKANTTRAFSSVHKALAIQQLAAVKEKHLSEDLSDLQKSSHN